MWKGNIDSYLYENIKLEEKVKYHSSLTKKVSQFTTNKEKQCKMRISNIDDNSIFYPITKQ